MCSTKSNRKDNIRRHVRNLHSDASENTKTILATIFKNYAKKSANTSSGSQEKCDENQSKQHSVQKSNTTSVIKFVGKLNIDAGEAGSPCKKRSDSPKDCSVIVNSSVNSMKTKEKPVTEPEDNALDSPDDVVYKPLTLEPPPLPPAMKPLKLIPPQDNIDIYRQLLSPYLRSAAKSKSSAQNETQASHKESTSGSSNNGIGGAAKGNSTMITKPPKKMYDKNEIFRSIMDKQ